MMEHAIGVIVVVLILIISLGVFIKSVEYLLEKLGLTEFLNLWRYGKLEDEDE